MIERVLQLSVSRGTQLLLPVYDETEGNTGIAQDQLFDKVSDSGGFRHRALQELRSGRCIEKQISYNDGRSVRRSDLLLQPRNTAFDEKARRRKFVSGLRNQLHPADSCNGGKRFSSEAERSDSREVLFIPDFACRMA